MLGPTDLTNPHDVEGLRRSVAMLPANTGQLLFTRDEALRLVDALRSAMKASEHDDPFA